MSWSVAGAIDALDEDPSLASVTLDRAEWVLTSDPDDLGALAAHAEDVEVRSI